MQKVEVIGVMRMRYKRIRTLSNFMRGGRLVNIIVMCVAIFFAKDVLSLLLIAPATLSLLLIEPSILSIFCGKDYNEVIFSPNASLQSLQTDLMNNGLIYINSVGSVVIYKLINADDGRVFVEENDGRCTMITAKDVKLPCRLQKIFGIVT